MLVWPQRVTRRYQGGWVAAAREETAETAADAAAALCRKLRRVTWVAPLRSPAARFRRSARRPPEFRDVPGLHRQYRKDKSVATCHPPSSSARLPSSSESHR